MISLPDAAGKGAEEGALVSCADGKVDGANAPPVGANTAQGTATSCPDTGKEVALRSPQTWQEGLAERNVAQDVGEEGTREGASASGTNDAQRTLIDLSDMGGEGALASGATTARGMATNSSDIGGKGN